MTGFLLGLVFAAGVALVWIGAVVGVRASLPSARARLGALLDAAELPWLAVAVRWRCRGVRRAGRRAGVVDRGCAGGRDRGCARRGCRAGCVGARSPRGSAP